MSVRGNKLRFSSLESGSTVSCRYFKIGKAKMFDIVRMKSYRIENYDDSEALLSGDQ